MYYTKCIIQNVLYKMYYTKCIIQNVSYKMYYTKCIIQNDLDNMYWTILTSANCLRVTLDKMSFNKKSHSQDYPQFNIYFKPLMKGLLTISKFNTAQRKIYYNH